MCIELSSIWLTRKLEKINEDVNFKKKYENNNRFQHLVQAILNQLSNPENLIYNEDRNDKSDWQMIKEFIDRILIIDDLSLDWKNIVLKSIQNKNEGFLATLIKSSQLFTIMFQKKESASFLQTETLLHLFYEACQHGSKTIVEELFAKGLKPDKQKALLIAFENNQREIVEILLKNKASIKDLSKPNQPALLTVIQKKLEINFFKLLALHGEDLHYIDKAAQNYLHLSIACENKEAFLIFLDNGINPKAITKKRQNIFHYAAQFALANHELALLKLVINDCSQLLLMRDESDKTALHYALEKRSKEVFLFILNELKVHGMTIQYQEAFPFEFSLFQELFLIIEKGNPQVADGFAKNNEQLFEKKEQLEWYFQRIHSDNERVKETFEFLYKKAAVLKASFLNQLIISFNPWTFKGLEEQSLHFAVMSVDETVVKKVIELGGEAKISSIINKKIELTPLQIAVKQGNYQMVDLLLKNGAILYDKNNSLDSALWLIDQNADINILEDAITKLPQDNYQSLLNETKDGIRIFLSKLIKEGIYTLIATFYSEAWIDNLNDKEKEVLYKYVIKYSDLNLLSSILTEEAENCSTILHLFAKYNLTYLAQIISSSFINHKLIFEIAFNKKSEVSEIIKLLEKILDKHDKRSQLVCAYTSINKKLLNGFDAPFLEIEQWTLLECAIFLRSNSLLEYCLKSYRSEDKETFLNRRLNKNGLTPFMLACKVGNIDTIHLFTKAQANPFAITEDRQTIFTILDGREDISAFQKYIAPSLLDLIELKLQNIPADFDLSYFLKEDRGQDLSLVFFSLDISESISVHKEFLKAVSKKFAEWIKEKKPSDRYAITYEGNGNLKELIEQLYKGKIEINYDNFKTINGLRSIFQTKKLDDALRNWFLEHPECEMRECENFDTSYIQSVKKRKLHD